MSITDRANEGEPYLAVVEDSAEPSGNGLERREGV